MNARRTYPTGVTTFANTAIISHNATKLCVGVLVAVVELRVGCATVESCPVMVRPQVVCNFMLFDRAKVVRVSLHQSVKCWKAYPK